MASSIYTDVTMGKEMSEHYTDFWEETLLKPKPIKNWPALLGKKSAQIIFNQENISKVLLFHGGVGRVTLELLRNCSNLSIDHASTPDAKYEVLKHLLEDGHVEWNQQIEGLIVERRKYSLNESEIGDSLLADKGNTITLTNLGDVPSYDAVIADFRCKRTGSDILRLLKELRPEGLLILGTIDDTTEKNPNDSSHSLVVLEKFCSPILKNEWLTSSHIFKQTQNKHQYAISHLSIWMKNPSCTMEEISTSQETAQNVTQTTADYYEDLSILKSYDRFHFGGGLLGVKNFPLRTAEVCLEAATKYNISFDAALDAGCGPGRSALELCKAFAYVEAYDYSQSFVNMMLEKMQLLDVTNVTAYQGDSHKQDEICHRKKFDLIHGCNLIDRLHSPQEWVLQSKSMLKKRGLLVISSPYTWLPEHTATEKWIGGFVRDGHEVFTLDGLRDLLEPELALLEVERIPFVIPDSDGTYQYTYSNCTVFGPQELRRQ